MSAHIFDFTKYEGSEIEHDFNFLIPKKFHQKYDIVIDGGSAEHIINFPQALHNLALITKTNGFIFQTGPVCAPNHGFYGYNPTLFYDFFENNGAKIKSMRLTTAFTNNSKFKTLFISNIPLYDRFRMSNVFETDLIKNNFSKEFLLNSEFWLEVITQKIEHKENIYYPIQNKYTQKEAWV